MCDDNCSGSEVGALSISETNRTEIGNIESLASSLVLTSEIKRPHGKAKEAEQRQGIFPTRTGGEPNGSDSTGHCGHS